MPLTPSSYRASVVERLLASIDLVSSSQACALLGIETDDPEGTINAMANRNALITLAENGEVTLPSFQFDKASGCIFEVVPALLELRPPRVSNLRLCYWLTRPHYDFGCPPAQVFGTDDPAILDAFGRYIEPEIHG